MIYDREKDRFVKFNGIRKEPHGIPWGPYWQYFNHSAQAQITLKILRFIRKHRDRITLIGVDNDKLDRDYDMQKIILKNLGHHNTINFFWAHNSRFI